MSAEIPGYDHRFDLTTQRVALAAAEVLKATGVEAGVAHTSGERAAEYGTQILIAALQEVHGFDEVYDFINPEVWARFHGIENQFKGIQETANG